MFTVSSRDAWGDPLTANLLATSSPAYVGKLGTWRYTPQVSVDTVFSKRTGKLAKRDSAVTYNQYVNSRGSLLQKLKARKEYTDDVNRQLLTPHSNAGPTHFSTTDTGNGFSVVHRRRSIVSDQITTAGGSLAVWDVIPTAPLPTKEGAGANGRVTFSGFPWSSYTDVSSLLTATSASVALSGGEKTKLQTDLISNLNPFRNEMSGLTAIGELAIGGLPKVVKNLQDVQAYARTSAGATDLEIRFGLAPLIRDITGLIWACLRLDQMLVARSARRRRRFHVKTYDWVNENLSKNDRSSFFPTNINRLTGSQFPVPSIGKVALGGANPTWDLPFTGSGSYTKGVRFFHQEVSINFTARYENGVKPTSTLNGYVDRALELLGLELTPDVVYNLTPWTWLLDWFWSLGSTVNYVSNFGLSNNVLNYAYFTQKITTQRGTFLWSPAATTASLKGACMVRETTDEILREQASPLGFGVSMSDLTQGQLDVLTAFGLMRPR